MKIQDKYPYDSAILGLNNIYTTVGNDSFYINSDCVLVPDKILTIGKEYFIFNFSTAPGNIMSDVLLVDCYYYEGVIHLIVEDIRGHRVFTISHCLECPGIDCPWVLVDLNFFHDLLDKKAIERYCGCAKEKQGHSHDSSLNSNEEMLDFEF